MHCDNPPDALVSSAKELVECCLQSRRKKREIFFLLSDETNRRPQSLDKPSSEPAMPFPVETEMRSYIHCLLSITLPAIRNISRLSHAKTYSCLMEKRIDTAWSRYHTLVSSHREVHG